MADPLSVAASVIGIAAFGIQIVKTLTTFTNVYRGAEQKIKSLTADVALTSSILKSIGETIDTYEKECRLTVENFIATRDTCRQNFDVLLVALRVVKKESTGDEATAVKKIDVWIKLKHALGGEQELKDLVASIETSKSNLQLLLDSLNLTILRSLSKKNLLSDEQADDFKLFMRHLPALVISIQKAGLMPMPATKGKEKVNNDGDTVSVTMYVVGATEGSEDPPDYVQNEAKGVDDFNVAATNVAPKKRAIIPEPSEPKQDSKESSQHGQADQSNSIEVNPLKNFDAGSTFDEQIAKNLDEQIAKNLGGGPMSSLPPHIRKGLSVDQIRNLLLPDLENEEPVATLSEPAIKGEHAGRESVNQQADLPSDSRNSVDIFEGWILEPEISSPPSPSIVKLCGFKILLYAGQEPPNYKVTLFSRDKAALKTWFPVSKGGAGLEHNNYVSRIPLEARHVVQDLLEDRNSSTRKPHSWKLESISPFIPRARTGFLLQQRGVKSKGKAARWMVVLRGGILASIEETGRDSTERYKDPWTDEVRCGSLSLMDSDSSIQNQARAGWVRRSARYREVLPSPLGLSNEYDKVMAPADAFDDIKRVGQDDWNETKKKNKSKRDSALYDYETRQDADLSRNDKMSTSKRVLFQHNLNYSPKSEGSGTEQYSKRKLSEKDQKNRQNLTRRLNSGMMDNTSSVVKNSGDEVLDPGFTQPQFRPSIDPQYGDLLPLPPSDHASPNVEPLDNLPRLPESRPDTPETERLVREKIKTAARTKVQDMPTKSPSQSQVPLEFQTRRPRPTFWDSTKEAKPLYLVERKTLRPSIPQLSDDEPLPRLPRDDREVASAVAAGAVAAAALAASELAEEGRRKDEELNSASARTRRRARRYSSISSLSDFGEASRWRRGDSEADEGSEEVLSEEQAEGLMSAYLDTFTADREEE